MLTNEQLTVLVTELTDRVRILEDANDRRYNEVNSKIDGVYDTIESVDNEIADIFEDIDDIKTVCGSIDTGLVQTTYDLNDLSDEVCVAKEDLKHLMETYEENYPLAKSFNELEKIFKSYYNKDEVKK